MVYEIILQLANKFGNLFVFAFILSRIEAFRKIVAKKPVNLKDKLVLSVVFGIFGIIGTYFSIEFNGALVNTRIIGVATGGLLGGPLVGLLAGLIAGSHRGMISIGAFTTTACAVSTVFEGLMAGYMGKLAQGKKNMWLYAALTGAIAESMRKISVLIFSRPFSVAVDVVKTIGLPMVLINSVGLALLFLILDNVIKDRQQVGAYQAQLTLRIADKTLPLLKKGLHSEGIREAAKIIRDMTDFDAVTITEGSVIIAHAGLGSDHHLEGTSIVTLFMQDVLQKGETKILQDRAEFACLKADCPLKSAIILPLRENEKIIGTLKLYKRNKVHMTPIDIELGSGLAQLFSTQLTLGRLEYNSKLLADAELKALQAQINPHFLFNSLAVIGCLCRVQPDKARELIQHLANFFRKNLNTNKQVVSLETELDHVKSYVEIELARFQEKLEVEYKIDEAADCYIPPLTLQPIIENSIKHGLLPKKNGGKIIISAERVDTETVIHISDNGVGMDESKIARLLSDDNSNTDNIGIYNVNKRLKGIFGKQYGLSIQSSMNEGTSVTIRIPGSSAFKEAC